MNCQRFESVVGDLARGQMMEADLRREALVHRDDCDECARRLQDEEQLTMGLRSLVAEMDHLQAPASLESKLLEAFRGGQVAPVIANHSHRRYWVAAAAAVLLIVFAVMAMRWRAGVAEAPKLEASAAPEPQPQQVITPSVQTPDSNNSEPEKKVIKRRPRNEFVAHNPKLTTRQEERPVANHAEVATEFIPVGYMNPASLQEGGQIIRVEVPRARLVSFGVPVSMERPQEKVKADVLVGVDGLARAIRFVRTVDKD